MQAPNPLTLFHHAIPIDWDIVASFSNVAVAAAAVWVAWHSSSESARINRLMLKNSLYEKKRDLRDAMIELLTVRPVQGGLTMESALMKARIATADLDLIISNRDIVDMKSSLLDGYARAIDARYDWEEANDIERSIGEGLLLGRASKADHDKAIKAKTSKRKMMDKQYRICEDILQDLVDLMNLDISLISIG